MCSMYGNERPLPLILSWLDTFKNKLFISAISLIHTTFRAGLYGEIVQVADASTVQILALLHLPAYGDRTDSVPKRRYIKFRRRGITQKKTQQNPGTVTGRMSSLLRKLYERI
jgi:hypothetical protein